MRRVLLLSTAVLLAACAGGEDEKAAYVERASAVCQEAVAEFEALPAPSTPDAIAPYAERLVAVIEDAQTELTALIPPEDDRAELESKVLEPLAVLVEEGRDYATRVREAGSDQAELLPLLSQRPSTDDVDIEFLRSYGLDSCADAVEQAG